MKRLGNWLVMFLKDERGAVMILVALLIVFVLIGMAALSVDVGYLYLQRRHLQNTADAAALAAAWELPWANPAITSTAQEYAGHNGIIYTEDGTVVSVTDAYGDRRAVRVEITKEYPLFFALAPPIGQSDADVYAMAVATRDIIGLDIMPFNVIGYDEIIKEKYRYHDYPENEEAVYKVNCPTDKCKPKKDEDYEFVDCSNCGVGTEHVLWGDWANDRDDFFAVLKDILSTQTSITIWSDGSTGNFELADMSAFSNSNEKGKDLIQYVLNNGLDYEFCKYPNYSRAGDTGKVSSIEQANPKPGGITLSERLARDEHFYIILVLPGVASKWTGANNPYGYYEFLIGYVKPLELKGGNQFYLEGNLIDVIFPENCRDWDPTTTYVTVKLIE